MKTSLAAALLAAIMVSGLPVSGKKAELGRPDTIPAKTITVALGKPFVLRKLQRASLKGTDASVRITGFINSPCPKGARCVWSGQAVHLELTVAGSTVALDASAAYSVEVLSSDYKTRAELLAKKRAP